MALLTLDQWVHRPSIGRTCFAPLLAFGQRQGGAASETYRSYSPCSEVSHNSEHIPDKRQNWPEIVGVKRKFVDD
jgi:hypothetical protein